ncbi:putative porin [Acidovorax sp. 100]|uniref:porin n=1 Tax=Acidovorax sp. 100 TaxID=2135635 RepID=UPI000EF9963C|nr:porin [Acidovorax sp. 100]RMA59967.1 putative porin [Acidovorax sp. 100]
MLKKSFNSALCLCALAGASSTMAQSQNQIYGQLRTSLNHYKTNGAKTTAMTDNASRIGFRGAEDLGDGLRALFGLEIGFESDTGAFSTPAFRYSYVGLASRELGTLVMGRLDSSAAGGSPLYSQVAGITTFAANDAGATAVGTSIFNSRNRVNNAIGYQTPTYQGLDARARFYMRGAGTAAEPEDTARSLDLGLNYRREELRLAIGYGADYRRGGLKANEFDSKWQVGARYDLGMLNPYVLVGQDKYNNTQSSRRAVDYWLIGVQFVSGAHSVVLNVMQRDVQTTVAAERKRQQLAYLYQLSKRTQLQTFFDNDGVNSSSPSARVRAFGVGVRHDF